MVVLINRNIQHVVLDFRYAEAFRYLMVAGLVKNITVFGVDMSLFWHTDNRKNVILILGKGAKQGLDNTILIAEKEYAMN